MSHQNHAGTIWGNITDGANRRHGPNKSFDPPIDKIPAGTSVIVLCYTRGETVTWTAPNGQTYMSDAWDFVVTSDQDAGGYVADVLIDTDGDIAQQFGAQGTCELLLQRLAYPSSPNQSPG